MSNKGNCDFALQLLKAGLSVVSADTREKKPVGTWKSFQHARPNEVELQRMFRRGDGLGIVTGAVSGNVEVIDFDLVGAMYPAWCDAVDAAAPGLRDRLYVERTPSGGVHVIYRSEDAVEGNAKLAQRSVAYDSGDEVEIAGKRYKPGKRADTDTFHVVIALIETRGEGGICLVAPSPGYVCQHGSLLDLPVLSAAEHAVLRDAAIGLNEHVPPVTPWTHSKPNKTTKHTANDGDLRPGDDFNQRGDVREVLVKHGWTLHRPGENEYWCRPGKTMSTSATLNAGVFFVHSTNATPFEPNTPYAPFGVFALLEHDGNFSNAASALRKLGFGSHTATSQGNSMPKIKADTMRHPEMPQDAVDSTPPATSDMDDEATQQDASDPGPFPQHLLQVPGFIGEVMEYNLATAHREQPIFALAGAIALQAVLAGRKVRDERGNRTNLYILTLGFSGAGKDHARLVNKAILEAADATHLDGQEELASDAGLVSLVSEQPAVLLQMDEFGRWLRMIGDPKKSPLQFAVVTTLMRMYSTAGTVFRGKAYSDSARNPVVQQPCVVLHATSAPEHFRKALTPDSMVDGFIARLFVFESTSMPTRQWRAQRPVPQPIVDAASWWTTYVPVQQGMRYEPTLVDTTPGGRSVFDELAAKAERAMQVPREDVRSVWARAEEKAARLALIFACSRHRERLVIDGEAAMWGCELSEYLTRKLLYMADQHVASSDFDADQKWIMREIIANGGSITATGLHRVAKRLDPTRRETILRNLRETGQVKEVQVATKGRPATVFQVVKRQGDASGN